MYLIYFQDFFLLCIFGLFCAYPRTDGSTLSDSYFLANCETKVEVQTRQECSPTKEKFCFREIVNITKVVNENVCKDVVEHVCGYSPEVNQHEDQQSREKSYTKFSEMLWPKAWTWTLDFVPGPSFSKGNKPPCHNVTTQQCYDIPKEIVVPEVVEQCQTITKEHCKTIPHEIHRKECSPITECPTGFIVQIFTDGGYLTKRQCVVPDSRFGKI